VGQSTDDQCKLSLTGENLTVAIITVPPFCLTVANAQAFSYKIILCILARADASIICVKCYDLTGLWPFVIVAAARLYVNLNAHCSPVTDMLQTLIMFLSDQMYWSF